MEEQKIWVVSTVGLFWKWECFDNPNFDPRCSLMINSRMHLYQMTKSFFHQYALLHHCVMHGWGTCMGIGAPYQGGGGHPIMHQLWLLLMPISQDAPQERKNISYLLAVLYFSYPHQSFWVGVHLLDHARSVWSYRCDLTVFCFIILIMGDLRTHVSQKQDLGWSLVHIL